MNSNTNSIILDICIGIIFWYNYFWHILFYFSLAYGPAIPISLQNYKMPCPVVWANENMLFLSHKLNQDTLSDVYYFNKRIVLLKLNAMSPEKSQNVFVLGMSPSKKYTEMIPNLWCFDYLLSLYNGRKAIYIDVFLV